MPLAFNCLGCALRDAPTQDAPGSWKGVCATCATAPICVPCDRVRLCAENIGKWSVRRDPFHLWDTGKGAVVSARKFYLTPSPDGNVRQRSLNREPPPISKISLLCIGPLAGRDCLPLRRGGEDRGWVARGLGGPAHQVVPTALLHGLQDVLLEHVLRF